MNAQAVSTVQKVVNLEASPKLHESFVFNEPDSLLLEGTEFHRPVQHHRRPRAVTDPQDTNLRKHHILIYVKTRYCPGTLTKSRDGGSVVG